MSINDLYTTKQKEVLKTAINSDWRFLINHGAKRSGKTVVDNDVFLMELMRVAKMAKKEGVETPLYILAGYSSKSIQNNILNELSNKYGFSFHFDKHNSFSLFGVKVIQTFTNSISGLGAIRGMTSWGAYINEASLANQEVFSEIVDRCSATGARIICDTNPDNPNHWLKTDYIDNTDPNARIKTFHFSIDDNTFLDKRYIEAQKASTPAGMFYDRSILGLWVTGEGAVYKEFDERNSLVCYRDIPEIKNYYVGVDWGFQHKGSILLFGDDYKGNTYLIEEYTSQFKYIDYWVDVAKNIKRRFGNINFWCDGARPEHVSRFVQEGLNALFADKTILDGIEVVSKMIKTKKLFVCSETVDKSKRDNTFFLDEIYNYSWDETSGKPVKNNDDVMDAMRYALYSEHLSGNVIESHGGF